MNKIEAIQKKVEELDKMIEGYVPPTKWEAANGRMLKRLKEHRNSYERAIERLQQREKDEQVRKEVSGDCSCGHDCGGKSGTIGGG